jgi:hypothetical protein
VRPPPGLFTTAPDGSDRQHLGELGHISALKHSTILPGGDDQCSFTFQARRPGRPSALRMGRWLTLSLAGVQWFGRLDEPSPNLGGWSVSAHGRGTFGSLYQAYYTGTYDGDGPVDAAISRGLPWIADTIDASIDSQQIPDPASITLEEHLTAVTDPLGKIWRVTTGGTPGRNLSIAGIGQAPSRLLVLNSPAGRATGDVVTRLYIRYLSGTDKYSTTSVVNQAADDEFGTTERFADFSDAGVMSAATAQSRGNGLLAKYLSAAWAGPFTATHGQWLTLQGAALDLATARANGAVAQMMFAGPASEGEWAAGLIPQFILGATEYDWDAEALTLTPLNSVRNSLPDLLSAAARTKYK